MNRFRITLLTVFGFLLLLSCDRNEVKPEPGLIRMQIAAYTVDCNGPFPQKCLLVKQDDEPNFLYFYNPIEGFTYELGYEYVLLVQRTTVTNPPADGSGFRYSLVKQISKVKP